nr:MAK10-like protein [Tanacetum cinerariifolium]
MGDKNHIHTLGDYSKPSHEGYMNTIEHPVGNNMDLSLYDNESWNDLRDFARLFKAIALPQDVPSTSDCRLIQLENQVQCLIEAHLAPTQPTQVNKVTTLFELFSSPHDTQYCMEDLEQAFVEYASSHTYEAGGKWYTFKPEKNNLGDTYNPSWRSHPNIRWRQPQNSQNNFSNPPNQFQRNGSISNRSFNNHPQSFNNQSNLKGLISNFMASQDASLSKFEADFKQQQSEMTNKINTVLKAIADRIVGALPNDAVKNPKLNASLVLSAHSYLTEDPQCSTYVHDPILGNNKWYQSLLRSFDQKKNNTQVQQSLLSWPSQRMRGLSQVEARLVEFKEQEIKFCERIKGLERDVEVRNNKIEYLTNELDEPKKEKESLNNKLTGFENASKDLENLLGSQRTDKNKEGLGYSAVPPPSCSSLLIS